MNSLFLFAPDGRIGDTVYNCPGTFHDSTMASYGLYETMIRVYERTGAKVVVDSAFKLDASNCLVKSGQTAPVDGDQLLLWKDATSIRQLSEWGMRMIQAQFPRLYDKIQLEDEGDRRVILRLMIALYNYQTYNIGHNEILNSYMLRKDGYYDYGINIAPDANAMFA